MSLIPNLLILAWINRAYQDEVGGGKEYEPAGSSFNVHEFLRQYEEEKRAIIDWMNKVEQEFKALGGYIETSIDTQIYFFIEGEISIPDGVLLQLAKMYGDRAREELTRWQEIDKEKELGKFEWRKKVLARRIILIAIENNKFEYRPTQGPAGYSKGLYSVEVIGQNYK